MDRKYFSRIGIAGVFCTVALLFAAAPSFGNIDNSFFSESDGLSGWSYSDNYGVDWNSVNLSTDGTGSAMIFQSYDASLSVLQQTFSMDIDSITVPQLLTFNLRTPQWGVSETDYLYINLLDESGDSLFGMENGFFQWNSDEGVFEGAENVTVDEVIDQTAGFAFYTVTVPVSQEWINDYVTLRFTLDSNPDDDFDSIILVDNVVLHGTSSTPVVPIPGAMGLALAGLTALGILKKKLI